MIVQDDKMMVGDPCYQVYRCLEYYQKFNNYCEHDQKMTKVLLNLPMIRKGAIDYVSLDHNTAKEHVKEKTKGSTHPTH